LGLVRRLAAKYRELGVPYEDLVQEGSVGLMEAIDHFDPHRGVAFDTFACFRVRRSILNALTDQARLIRLPKHVVERRRLIERAAGRAVAATGTEPTSGELAAVTGLSREIVEGVRRPARSAASLDAAAGGDGGGGALMTLIQDPSAEDPEREAVLHETVQATREAVSRLSPRRREIIVRHFGLDGPEDSMANLAHDLHLSERRARTIEADALHELAIALEPTG
jgi:RNA polymerase primary sigma factor